VKCLCLVSLFVVLTGFPALGQADSTAAQPLSSILVLASDRFDTDAHVPQIEIRMASQEEQTVKAPAVSAKRVLRVTGAILMVYGTTTAYLNNEKAQALYSQYHNSAFTERTDELRPQVEQYDQYTKVSVGVACGGLLLVVLSF
jgi:hypothetical protein